MDRLGAWSSCAGQRATQPAPALRPPKARAIASACMARLPSGKRAHGVRVEVLGFVVLDVLQAVHDAPAELEVNGPLADPAPAFERARRDAPTLCKLMLVEMTR